PARRAALFHRHPRGLQTTEQGRILHDATHDMAAKISLASAALADSRDKPSGPLRVFAPTSLGSAWLTPRLRPFMEAYPEIALEIRLADAAEPSSSEVEAAIHLQRPTHADLVQRKLMTVSHRLYASPDYLARRGAPGDLRELAGHQLITYGGYAGSPLRNLDWLVGAADAEGPAKPALAVNSVLGMLHAVEAGLGIGSLPEYLVEGSRRLVPILPDAQGPDIEIYFVYPEELRGNRRIAAFRDFVFRQARSGLRST
ncbi:MAG: substrate binding domain-containing protein, partial [Caulobacterales bacterium]|nr:substrate binding domain-containing protein [Caulobacterales bacterium]